MTRRRTRGEAAIEALLGKLDPTSDRYRVLSAARDFKASWVELGERLTEVRESQLFKKWSYPTFESYCRQELRLKGETATKLTRSFAFLRDHEPKALETREERELPALDVVDLLSRARERAKVTDAQLATIQDEVFDGEAPPTKSELIKRFREVDPDAFRAAPRAVKPAGEGDVRKALLLAERLQSLLEADESVSQRSRDGIKGIVGELRRLFEATRTQAAAG